MKPQHAQGPGHLSVSHRPEHHSFRSSSHPESCPHPWPQCLEPHSLEGPPSRCPCQDSGAGLKLVPLTRTWVTGVCVCETCEIGCKPICVSVCVRVDTHVHTCAQMCAFLRSSLQLSPAVQGGPHLSMVRNLQAPQPSAAATPERPLNSK